MGILRRKGQSTAEYAIIIALVIGAAVAMQTYTKRSMQSGVKYAVDKLQKEKDDKSIGQYEPYYLESGYNTTTGAYTNTETTLEGGAVNRTIGNKTTTREGVQKVKDVGAQPAAERPVF